MKNGKYILPIDRGIPLPGARNSAIKYPFREMRNGDSFFIPDGDNRTRASVFTTAARLGVKVSTRSVDGGLRVWRVK